LNASVPKTFEPHVSDFDKLRKRVQYLAKKRTTAANAMTPPEMQLYKKFIEEDEAKWRQ